MFVLAGGWEKAVSVDDEFQFELDGRKFRIHSASTVRQFHEACKAGGVVVSSLESAEGAQVDEKTRFADISGLRLRLNGLRLFRVSLQPARSRVFMNVSRLDQLPTLEYELAESRCSVGRARRRCEDILAALLLIREHRPAIDLMLMNEFRPRSCPHPVSGVACSARRTQRLCFSAIDLRKHIVLL